MTPPQLAVILLHWNDAERTVAAYQRLAKWQLIQPYLIIVDNHSTPTELDQLTQALATTAFYHPGVVLKNAVNGGFAGGNNLGIQIAIQQAIPYTLLLNTDALISEAAVLDLLKTLENQPKIGILGPSIKEGTATKFNYLIGGRNIAKYSFTRISAALEEVKQLPDYPLHFVDYVSGTIFLARTSIFRELGGLEERYFFSGEIADFCQLARSKQYQVAVNVSVIGEHLTDQTNSQLRDTLYVYYNFRNRFLYVRRHYNKQQVLYFFFWSIQAFRQIPGAILSLNVKKIRAILWGLWDGIRGRYGNRNELF